MKTFKQKFVGQKWRLKNGLLYAGLTPKYLSALVGPNDALIFDERDNRDTKKSFAGALHNVQFEVEEIV